MAVVGSELYRLNKLLVWQGFKQLAPIGMFVAAFGAAFGLAATQAGLAGSTTLTMSMVVFTGTAQFAILDLWGPELPLFTILLTVFAINSRHLLMGATLYPWLRQLPPAQRYGVMLVVSDANWAMAMQTFNRKEPGLGVLLGGGIALWLYWVLGTWLGVYFGNVISNPKAFGIDMVMACFLLALVLDTQKSLSTFITWGVAATASLLAYWFLPENSHVIVGALAGGIAGTMVADKSPVEEALGAEKNEP